MFNFKDDVKIDMCHLDKEWARQPELMYMYGEECAKARLSLQKEEEKLELLKATLSTEIRSNPDKFGLGKVTEGLVEATITINPEFQKQLEVVRNLQYDNEVLKSAVMSLHHKKSELENIVRLQGLSYYSEPNETEMSNINKRI